MQTDSIMPALTGDAPVHSYLDAQAIEDGLLADVSSLRVHFHGLLINRITGTLFDGWQRNHPHPDDPDSIHTDTLRTLIVEARDRAVYHGDIWHTTTEGETRLWIIENETGHFSMIYPEDY